MKREVWGRIKKERRRTNRVRMKAKNGGKPNSWDIVGTLSEGVQKGRRFSVFQVLGFGRFQPSRFVVRVGDGNEAAPSGLGVLLVGFPGRCPGLV